MDRRVELKTIILFLFISASTFTVSLAGTSALTRKYSPTTKNPFTPKAFLIRYWDKHISNKLPKPSFLFSKASPLSAVNSALFTQLAAQNTLSSHLSFFCSAANLFCLLDTTQTLTHHNPDSNFALYSNKHFNNYGTSRLGGVDSFKNYSQAVNFATGSFTRYSQSSTAHQEKFTTYATDANVANSNFTSYAFGSTGGFGEFKNYAPNVNVPDLRFTSYDSNSNNHPHSFSSYANDTNSGNEGFTNYAKSGSGVPVDFVSYGDTSNIIGSTFTGYGELGNGLNDSFAIYSSNANKPNNNFKGYSVGGNIGVDSFSNYRDGANVGADTFQSYGKNSNSEKTNFRNYGKSFNGGMDMFKEYGEGSRNQLIGFKIYVLNATFKDYAHKGITFGEYTNSSSMKDGSLKVSGNSVNMWLEPGKFFREYMLKEGTVMKMPDIRDKIPTRSFLPRAISSKLPFSTTQLMELKRLFHVWDNSTMERVLVNALAECERSPSRGETKRCVGSVEDMIDFSVSVLGHNVAAKTTENATGPSGM